MFPRAFGFTTGTGCNRVTLGFHRDTGGTIQIPLPHLAPRLKDLYYLLFVKKKEERKLWVRRFECGLVTGHSNAIT